jgi:hypothetical protein
MDRDHYVIRGGVEGRERLRIMARFLQPTTNHCNATLSSVTEETTPNQQISSDDEPALMRMLGKAERFTQFHSNRRSASQR